MLSVQVIASSSAGNAYALHPEDGGAPLLLEAGIRYKELQRGLDFGVSKLAGCLVSHEHMDHARAAKDVMKAGVNVYATAGTLKALDLSGHRTKTLPKLSAHKVEDWQVLAFPTVHDAADPCGFLIRYRDDAVLYVTDSAYCAYRFAGITVAMVEANYSLEVLTEGVARGRVEPQQAARVIRNHLSLERCIELLKANDLSRCREIHLLHMSGGNSDEAAFKAAVQAATGKPVFVAAERTPA